MRDAHDRAAVPLAKPGQVILSPKLPTGHSAREGRLRHQAGLGTPEGRGTRGQVNLSPKLTVLAQPKTGISWLCLEGLPTGAPAPRAESSSRRVAPPRG